MLNSTGRMVLAVPAMALRAALALLPLPVRSSAALALPGRALAVLALTLLAVAVLALTSVASAAPGAAAAATPATLGAPATAGPASASTTPAAAVPSATSAASTANVAPATTAPPGNESSIATGKTLFNTVGCWSCHGFNGQGAMSRGIASGPHINARILPEAAFIHQLRAPIGVMPPYTADVLTDEQVSAIYDYLRSLPVGPTLKDIPLLSQP